MVWFHTASLGEYEQAVPILKEIKKTYPSFPILVTFFSPSGFEVKKNDTLPHAVTYLPLDTVTNAHKFIQLLDIRLAVFVKYEVWPNYLKALNKAKIPTLLIAALFRKDQIYFQSYGGFMKKALHTFQHIFVQNESSYQLLKQHGFSHLSISGDTRYDRVAQQLLQNNRLSFMEIFTNQSTCVVMGSSWPEDEAIYIHFINASKEVKFVIAPHEIKQQKIQDLIKNITKKVVLHSEINEKNLANADVLIIDNIGLLSAIYAYADVAYVGGGMGNAGLHNILEPATFGIPILIGKNHHRFPEASQLQEAGGLVSVSNQYQLEEVLNQLLSDLDLRKKMGEASKEFVVKKTGATAKIMNLIHRYLSANDR